MALPAKYEPCDLDNPRIDRERLAFLRLMALRAKCAARLDLFAACAVLSADNAHPSEGLAMVLFRGLGPGEVFTRFCAYEPSATEVSFDERWLLAALEAADRQDTDSLSFMIARRVPHPMRRNIGYLIKALAGAMRREGLRHVA